MPQQSKFHRFRPKAITNGRKARNGKIKSVRAGSRNPGATGQGSVRRPF